VRGVSDESISLLAHNVFFYRLSSSQIQKSSAAARQVTIGSLHNYLCFQVDNSAHGRATHKYFFTTLHAMREHGFALLAQVGIGSMPPQRCGDHAAWVRQPRRAGTQAGCGRNPSGPYEHGAERKTAPLAPGDARGTAFRRTRKFGQAAPPSARARSNRRLRWFSGMP
jgi:hypothetical protein